MTSLIARKMKRRAVSQVIGSLIMMAVVAAIGSLVLFQGLIGIQNFNTVLGTFMSTNKDSSSESLIIEHVRFETSSPTSCQGTGSPCVTIYIRNVGTVDVNIKTIKMININTQALDIYQNNVNLAIPVKTMNSIQYTGASVLVQPIDVTQTYKISIVTDRGNSFNIIATWYNT